MAKRDTGLGNKKVNHPHKTQKRLAVKKAMLEERANKNKNKRK